MWDLLYFSVKVSVIGSREQLCIQEQVRKEPNNSNKVGQTVHSNSLCLFYLNTYAGQGRQFQKRVYSYRGKFQFQSHSHSTF